LLWRQPFTFTATAEVTRYFGAHPLFADIDSATINIDPAKVAEVAEKAAREGKKVRAILPVHYGGLACDLDSLGNVARKYSLKIVEDAAHAFPASYHGGMIGSIGDLTAFSFYVTKPLATGEGGMVTTANEEYARRIKTMRLHGINRDIWGRYSATKPNWYYEVVAPGYKYNLTDIAASIGIHQLRKAERFRLRREEIAKKYTDAFRGLSIHLPPHPSEGDIHSWHLYVIRLRLDQLTIGRDRFIELMAERGIGTSVHFIPLHLHPYWKEKYGFRPEDFPVSLETYRCCVSLPIYTRMTDSDVSRVIEAVHEILRDHSR
jgi:dTDP-4-amino-4,6-dideoxygalactose transaminase